jgi:hypothetical protein
MLKRLPILTGIGAVLAVMTIGVREAAAAHTFARIQSCGSYNWCAPSQGGDMNCSACCRASSSEYVDGFCYDYREEDNFQGCLCF